MPSEAEDPKRILVIGSAGSGKSTLARAIGLARDLPVYHMDRDVFYLPGWVERPKRDQLAQIERIIAEDAWVFEGNNSRSFAIREARAQMLIWLDTPLILRLWRVVKRGVMHNGQTRPDMAEGCAEKLSMLPGFIWFILRTARASRRKQSAFFEGTSLRKHRLRSTKAAKHLLDTMKPAPIERIA